MRIVIAQKLKRRRNHVTPTIHALPGDRAAVRQSTTPGRTRRSSNPSSRSTALRSRRGRAGTLNTAIFLTATGAKGIILRKTPERTTNDIASAVSTHPGNRAAVRQSTTARRTRRSSDPRSSSTARSGSSHAITLNPAILRTTTRTIHIAFPPLTPPITAGIPAAINADTHASLAPHILITITPLNRPINAARQIIYARRHITIRPPTAKPCACAGQNRINGLAGTRTCIQKVIRQRPFIIGKIIQNHIIQLLLAELFPAGDHIPVDHEIRVDVIRASDGLGFLRQRLA